MRSRNLTDSRKPVEFRKIISGRRNLWNNGDRVNRKDQHVCHILQKFILPPLALLIVLAIFYLLAPVARVLLVIFSGILFAIFIAGISRFLTRKIHLPYRVALGCVLVALIGLFTLFGWVAGPSVNEQFNTLTDRLPKAIENLNSFLKQFGWTSALLNNSSEGDVLSWSKLLGGITGFFSFTAGVIADFFIIVFLGIYLAFSPAFYKDNIVRIFPQQKRARVRKVLKGVGHGLGWWLVGRLSSMLAVGLLITLGLWLIGQPLAIILGVIAGLLSFVPYIGPVLSVIPAILVALIENVYLVVWVLAVYGAAQFLESYLITPLIQKKAVSTPPALLISVQFLMAIVFGFYGVLLATPLTVAIIILIQMLYIEDILGEPVRLLGDH